MNRTFKDISGKTYNRLTAVKRVGVTKNGESIWECGCICGDVVNVLLGNLQKGNVKSCGCLKKEIQKADHERLVGMLFGYLTVLSFLERRKGYSWWSCKCKCGNRVEVVGYALISGKTKSCGCLFKEIIRKPYKEASFNSIYSEYKKRAIKRNLEFSLERDYFKEITLKACTYCGTDPSQFRALNGMYGTYVYNGIDRVDSDKGYTVDNCVPCCAICNRAKYVLSVEEFQEWINRLIKFQLSKNDLLLQEKICSAIKLQINS